MLGFACYMVSITTQLCHCGVKAAIDNTQTNEGDCLPIKFYLENRWSI